MREITIPDYSPNFTSSQPLKKNLYFLILKKFSTRPKYLNLGNISTGSVVVLRYFLGGWDTLNPPPQKKKKKRMVVDFCQ